MRPSVCSVAVLFVVAALGEPTPGCKCSMEQCCAEYMARSFGGVFAQENHGPSIVVRDIPSASPACTLLNMIPDAASVCSAFKPATEVDSPTVCDTLKSNLNAQKKLVSQSNLVGAFMEPGKCEEVKTGCWTPPSQTASWGHYRFSEGNTCSGVFPVKTPSLALSLKCPAAGAEGGILLSAKWADGTKNESRFDTCDGDYSDGLQMALTTSPAMWIPSDEVEGLHWNCADIPHGELGTEDYRVLVYSVGGLPCIDPSWQSSTSTATSTTTTEEGAGSSFPAWALILIAFALLAGIAGLAYYFLVIRQAKPQSKNRGVKSKPIKAAAPAPADVVSAPLAAVPQQTAYTSSLPVAAPVMTMPAPIYTTAPRVAPIQSTYTAVPLAMPSPAYAAPISTRAAAYVAPLSVPQAQYAAPYYATVQPSQNLSLY